MTRFSELNFIRKISSEFKISSPEIIRWIGDDTAVIAFTDKEDLLITTDLLTEDVHFSLDYFKPEEIGWRALTANLSDIAAMGGKPLYFTLSIAIPPHLKSGDFLDRLLLGFRKCSEIYKVELIGGDTSSSKTDFFIDIMMIGISDHGKALLRKGAKQGDDIMIFDHPGLSEAGLQLFRNKWRIDEENLIPPAELELTAEQKAKITLMMKAHLTPRPMLEEGSILSHSGLVTSMIDTSDGISTDLMHICEESGTGAVLNYAAFDESIFEPLKGIISPIDPASWILNGGEDYLLLFTTADGTADVVINKFREADYTPPRIIGKITDDKGSIKIIHHDGTVSPLLPHGWQHK